MLSRSQTKTLRQSGFTLVELLIVIVVVAILAAISIVAYNGIQDRARLSKITASVEATTKLLQLYKTDHGEYPNSNNRYYCIGTLENFPAQAPFESGACNYWDGATTGVARVNSDFNNTLLHYANNIPDGSIPVSRDSSSNYQQRGLFYFRENFTGNAYLTYGIAGDRDCHIGEKRNWYVGMTTCEVILETE